MKDIIIIGAGGFGREVEWIINRINKEKIIWNILGFADDNVEKDTKIGNNKVCCSVDELANSNTEISVVIAIGNSVVRKKIYEKLSQNENIKFPNIIDPDTILGEVKMGEGNIICAATIMTVNILISNFVIVNLDCTIGHDDVIENFVTIYPSVNVSGNVTVGQCTEIGTGTQIIQGKNIINNVIIGAGAVVTKDILQGGTYVGVPAKRMEKTV